MFITLTEKSSDEKIFVNLYMIKKVYLDEHAITVIEYSDGYYDEVDEPVMFVRELIDSSLGVVRQ